MDKTLFGKPVWLKIAQELVRFINRLRHKRTETGRRIFPESSQMKFTARNVGALTLPDDKADHLVFDDAVPGFGLRIRDGGYGSFSTSSERSSGASYWATQAR